MLGLCHSVPVSLCPCLCCAQALFTRLLLPEPGSHLIHMTCASSQNLSADRDAGERQILRYLYACFRRAREEVGTGGEKAALAPGSGVPRAPTLPCSPRSDNQGPGEPAALRRALPQPDRVQHSHCAPHPRDLRQPERV